MTTKHKNATSVPASAADAPASSTPVSEAAPGTVSAEEIELLKAAAGRADENWDKFLRAAADLENYRKRVVREREELVRSTSERVVAALLPILDNLERALDAADKEVEGLAPSKPQPQPSSQHALLAGLKQIQTQFRRTLEEFGLQEVAARAGHPFDPNHHEAISHVESAEHPEGTIIDQLQRGYKLADRLLRPARVVVSKGKSVDGAKADKQDSSPAQQ